MPWIRISIGYLLAAMVVLLMSTARVPAQAPDAVWIPAGSYQPLYGNGVADRISVTAFRLDRDAVTRAEYGHFLLDHPEWRRNSVRSGLVDRSGYLVDWADDMNPGIHVSRDVPVTNVSWFAARAYCNARGKRLPTVAEWEYVAAASANMRDAAGDPRFIQSLVELYAVRAQQLLPVRTAQVNAYGVRGMHDRVSEWVEDFNSVLVSDDSREAGARDHGLYCASAAIGAADPSDYAAFLRFALRSGLSGRSTIQTLGFRCAA